MKICTFLFLVLLVLTSLVSAQRRDHLTDKEADLIRYNQELDKRIDIYAQAIERRLALLSGKKLSEKEVEKFGEPSGSTTDILSDIPRILLEAIEKIDDVAERDSKNKILQKSLQMLATACQKFSLEFESLGKKFISNRDKGLIISAIDYCQQVIEASQKLQTSSESKQN